MPEPMPADDEITRRARARLGSVLRERWHLDALLGVGGMAAVYAATHRNNGKRVAIKMLHLELSTSTEIRRRFIDEGYAANRVAHPGAVSVLDDDVAEDGAVFLVMDLLEGETLETRLRRVGRLSAREVLAVTDALLDVLAAAHDHGIVHRDVKPDNIFITTEDVVMLLDFGIARMVVEGRPRTTIAGATMGTPAFMAPEQARGRWEDIDGRADLWAVGATMFVQLTGRVVHQAETTNEELLCAMTKPAPSLRAVAPELPASVIELVDRALAFEQSDRWNDARSMQAAVREAFAALDGNPTPAVSSGDAHETIHSTSPQAFTTLHQLVSNSDRPLARRAGRRTLWWGGAALAVAALTVLVFALQTQHRSTPPGTAAHSVAQTVVEPAVDLRALPESALSAPATSAPLVTSSASGPENDDATTEAAPAPIVKHGRALAPRPSSSSHAFPARELKPLVARPAERTPTDPAPTTLAADVPRPAVPAPAAPAARPAAAPLDPLERRK